MEKRLVEINKKFVQQNRPMIGMRIGISTGTMVGCIIGSKDRLEYNLHGDSVNIGARLESFDKENFAPDYASKPCRILLSAATVDRIGDEFVMAQVGEVPLRGMEVSTAVFRVMGVRSEAAGETGNPAPDVVNATPDRVEFGEHT
jgi:class 3 adenylate cyclase